MGLFILVTFHHAQVAWQPSLSLDVIHKQFQRNGGYRVDLVFLRLKSSCVRQSGVAVCERGTGDRGCQLEAKKKPLSRVNGY